MVASRGFIQLCIDELSLCEVTEHEVVAIISQGSPQEQAYAESFMSAARELGAEAFTVVVTPRNGGPTGATVGVTPLAGNRAAIEALKGADLVIDLVFLLFSPEQLEVQDSGTRMLLVVEPEDTLARMFPTAALRRRVEAGEAILSRAESLRFTNAAGTDVSYELGSLPVLTEYGYTATPGRWDHWPAGLVATGASEAGVSGTVVLAPGDIVLPFKTYVRSPVELSIVEGRIVRICGELDAQLLKDYIESYNDERAYAISHIGWGLNENARWSGLAADQRGIGMEARSFLGNVLFSTGPNTELGGSNDTSCHLDLPMRNCDLYLDDRQIISKGQILPEEMRIAN